MSQQRNRSAQPKWTFASIVKTFGLEQVLGGTPLLHAWLAAPVLLDDAEKMQLESIRQELEANVLYWNEEELKMNFISTVVRMVRFDNGVRTYFDREIEATVQGRRLKAKFDYMIAKGFGDIIETPYFCFHEYKQEKHPSEDPVAQLFRAMLIARESNQNQKPVYGCYVIGRNWHFVVLEGNAFSLSNPYAATDVEELEQIARIFKYFKEILYASLV